MDPKLRAILDFFEVTDPRLIHDDGSGGHSGSMLRKESDRVAEAKELDRYVCSVSLNSKSKMLTAAEKSLLDEARRAANTSE